MEKLACALIRVSTTRQLDNASKDYQRKEILKAASEQGFDLPEELIFVTAESGVSPERVGYDKIFEAIDTHEISRVYVYSVDRLSRSLSVMLQFVEKLEKLGIEVYSIARREVLESSSPNFVFQGLTAQAEHTNILERSRNGLGAKAAKGRYCGGIVPYGYYVDPKTDNYCIHPERSKIITYIYELCVNEHKSTIEIADLLNSQAIPTGYQIKDLEKGNEIKNYFWTPGRILYILKNTFYKGLRVYGKNGKPKIKKMPRITSIVPAIITEDIWEKAQIVLKANRIFIPVDGKQKYNYLFKSLIRCGYCGRAFCGSVSKTSSGMKRYYKCTGRAARRIGDETRCVSPVTSISAEPVENQLWTEVINFIQGEKRLKNLLKKSNELKNTKEVKEITEIERLQKSLLDLDKEEFNMIVMQTKLSNPNLELIDKVSVDLQKKRSDINNRLNELMIKEPLNSKSLLGNSDYFLKRLKYIQLRAALANECEKRRIIVELIENIVVHSDRIEVTHRMVEAF